MRRTTQLGMGLGCPLYQKFPAIFDPPPLPPTQRGRRRRRRRRRRHRCRHHHHLRSLVRIKAMVTELMASPEKDQIDTVTVQEVQCGGTAFLEISFSPRVLRCTEYHRQIIPRRDAPHHATAPPRHHATTPRHRPCLCADRHLDHGLLERGFGVRGDSTRHPARNESSREERCGGGGTDVVAGLSGGTVYERF